MEKGMMDKKMDKKMKDKPMMPGMKSMAMDNQGTPVEVDSPSYPGMRMNMKNMPGLKDSKVGDSHMFLMQGKIKGIEQYGDGDTHVSMDMTHADMVEESKAGE